MTDYKYQSPAERGYIQITTAYENEFTGKFWILGAINCD